MISHPLQAAFREKHALQCGYCTPGFLMTLIPFLEENPQPTEAQVRDAISGNICRCTGYQNIVDAVLLAAEASPGAQTSSSAGIEAHVVDACVGPALPGKRG